MQIYHSSCPEDKLQYLQLCLDYAQSDSSLQFSIAILVFDYEAYSNKNVNYIPS